MREQLERRVNELKAEQQRGQQMLAELEGKEADLQQTLLRISGAIQVLEELLAVAEPSAPNGTAPAAATHPRQCHYPQLTSEAPGPVHPSGASVRSVSGLPASALNPSPVGGLAQARRAQPRPHCLARTLAAQLISRHRSVRLLMRVHPDYHHDQCLPRSLAPNAAEAPGPGQRTYLSRGIGQAPYQVTCPGTRAPAGRNGQVFSKPPR
jgi:hypothetical protein